VNPLGGSSIEIVEGGYSSNECSSETLHSSDVISVLGEAITAFTEGRIGEYFFQQC